MRLLVETSYSPVIKIVDFSPSNESILRIRAKYTIAVQPAVANDPCAQHRMIKLDLANLSAEELQRLVSERCSLYGTVERVSIVRSGTPSLHRFRWAGRKNRKRSIACWESCSWTTPS